MISKGRMTFKPSYFQMPSTTRHSKDPRTAAPPANLKVVNWPLRDDGIHAWAFVALVVGLAVAIGFVSNSFAVSVFGFVVMSLAMWRMWIPIAFEFGPRGIYQTVLHTKRRIAWSTIRRCVERKRGILLLFSEDSSPLANALGLYIRWGTSKEELLNIIGYYAGDRLRY